MTEGPTYTDPMGITWGFTNFTGPGAPLMACGLPDSESLNEDYAWSLPDDAPRTERTLREAVTAFYDKYGGPDEKAAMAQLSTEED